MTTFRTFLLFNGGDYVLFLASFISREASTYYQSLQLSPNILFSLTSDIILHFPRRRVVMTTIACSLVSLMWDTMYRYPLQQKRLSTTDSSPGEMKFIYFLTKGQTHVVPNDFLLSRR